MKILLTGCAGFIGSHVLDRLMAEGHTVVGVDNFDPFYPRSLKQANLAPHLGGRDRDAPAPWGAGVEESWSESGGASSTTPKLHDPTPPSPATKGVFELVEGDLAEPTTYTKIRFIAEGLRGTEVGGQGTEDGGRRTEDADCIGASLRSAGTTEHEAQGIEGAESPNNPLASDFCSPASEQPPLFGAIIHLAAKTGVRPSIGDPLGYQRANVIATQNLLEFAREQGIRQFVFASSSSVYGVNPRVPWREDDHVLEPISPYASTKVSGELLGHVYSHLHGIRFLALRFFTVYGPRQRPDLAINKFVRLIDAGEPIPVFGDGSTRRDYTYVGDIVEGILGALHYNKSAFEVVNLGNNRTLSLSEMIATIEAVLGKQAILDRQPEQPGDVPQTWADVSKAAELFGYAPTTSFKEGVSRFYQWWRDGDVWTEDR